MIFMSLHCRSLNHMHDHHQVHRGTYEAAQVLYERFLPLIYEHLDSSPFSKISFTVRAMAPAVCAFWCGGVVCVCVCVC